MTMTPAKEAAYYNMMDTDKAWQAELVKAFGRDACNARYEKRGRGAPGTPLQQAHDAWQAAMNTARAFGIVP